MKFQESLNEDQNINIESPSSEIPKSEVREYSKEYAPWARQKLADQLKIIRLKSELNPEERRAESEKIRENFYNRFYSEKTDFEKSLEARRVMNLSKQYNCLFIHSIPVAGKPRGNTSLNNHAVDAIKELPDKERVSQLLASDYDLSCSTISFDDRTQNQHYKEGTMYPFGLIIGGGTILSAYRFDGSTVTEKDKLHKKSKADPETQDTSIQKDIERRIENILTRKMDQISSTEYRKKYHGHWTSPTHYDEFVITKPEAIGFYIDLDGDLVNRTGVDPLDSIADILKDYPNIPVYIRERKKLRLYTANENGEILPATENTRFQELK